MKLKKKAESKKLKSSIEKSSIKYPAYASNGQPNRKLQRAPPESSIKFPASRIEKRVSRIEHPVFRIEHPVSRIKNRVPRISKNPQLNAEDFSFLRFMKTTETENIISLLEQCYEKDAWHGPTFKEVIANVTHQTALNRLPNTHSIIELVLHMTAWRNFTVEKLKGNSAFDVTPEMNFPQLTDWNEALRKLEKSQQALLEELKNFPDAKLDEAIVGNATPYTFRKLLYGLINHDVYHTGQIVLIHKATESQSL